MVAAGEGRFGKVYTAVNNLSGELIAMKEVQIRLQPNDHRSIKEALDEIKIFEGIKHPNLVRYYGVEVHKEELLIFMELCNEGSLESAAQANLPETLIRKYTCQLLEAVHTLHEHGIVHRDIKSANVFLTSEGQVKLGDFGCCIRLKSQSTIPGELCEFVGTPAYMAPEVFTRNRSGGHGRAADIWGVGCVVLEMASGQRPWHELESSYQIMFRVGMGEAPTAPHSLSEEGQDFLDHCFEIDPSARWTSGHLLDHPFTKVSQRLWDLNRANNLVTNKLLETGVVVVPLVFKV
ncbi:MAP3K4 [Cordylochernes scorpioides]|uniref:MAP3K4 n=1 Tax=Cordylochernes scorpioides TaxID=51811 RepID=A0ABY6LI53_9ARAC|nr:MAP3K4 [Cordylochernes scorpioides]